ncbi:MAG: hypothetical protein AB7T20_05525 [Steroidobacteraceae bacterium]
MPLTRPLVRILAAIAILAVAAFAVLWIGARTGFARGLAADRIGEATGLPATVGSLRAGFLPRPYLVVGGLAVTQPPGFDAGPLIEAGEVRIAVPWSSLFGGADIASLSIADLVARPMKSADGADNWSGLLSRLAELGGEGASGWSIGKLEFERGALEFHDLASRSQWRLTAITIAARDIAPAVAFPLELRLAGVAGPNTFHFALNGHGIVDPDAGSYAANGLSFRGWAGGEPLPLAGIEMLGAAESASYDSATGIAAVPRGTINVTGIPGEFMLRLQPDDPGAPLAFSVKTDSFGPRAPAIAFGFPLPAAADPKVYESLQVSFEGHMVNGVLHVDPIAGRLDDSQFDGRVVPAERLIRAQIDRIDVNRYLPPGQERAKEKKATLEALIKQLGEFDIDAEIRIGEARVAGAKLRDSVIRVERNAAPAQ